MYELRISQRELARRLEVSQPWVQGRLAGDITITVADVERIAAALGVPVTQLLPTPATDSPTTVGAGGRGTGASVPAGDGRQETGPSVPGPTRTEPTPGGAR
jgi:transcriptional regulator with XRE-family HTH domain